MALSADVLRRLHRIHRQLRDLRERVERGPKQIAARQGHVKRLGEQLAVIRQDELNARAAADAKELDLKTSEGKIKELKNKLNNCKTNREFQTLKEQIAADEMAASVLQDEVLEGIEKAEEEEARLVPANEELKQAEQESEKVKQSVAGQAESLQTDITRLEGDLQESENLLPDDVRGSYDRSVKRNGSDALTSVDGMTCTGCYQQIRVNMYNLLTLSEIVFCDSCGRMLYLPEDHVPVEPA
ncbi:MAG: hypothetical protein N2C14_12565 [Planctomycetales bacterium]